MALPELVSDDEPVWDADDVRVLDVVRVRLKLGVPVRVCDRVAVPVPVPVWVAVADAVPVGVPLDEPVLV